MEHEDWLEKAEFFALGVLEGDDMQAFESHLAAGCAVCRTRVDESATALNQLATGLDAFSPQAEQKTRLFERIDSDKPGLIYIHAGEGNWLEVEPGIFAKILNRDSARKTVTAIVRMAPGSRYEDHRHTSTEEVLVLEGSCYCGGRLLRKGDYHRAEPGSSHFDTRTEEGSLMLLTTAVQNQPT
jgi:quercetin dioxygenase-like cupin family protein